MSSSTSPAPATNPITVPSERSASLRLQLLKDHLDINKNVEKPWERYKQEFKYTVTPWADDVLTREEREFYETNGYIIKKNVCTKEECDRWSQRFMQYARGQLEPAPGMGLMRDLGAIKKVKSGELPKEALKSEHTLYKINDFFNDPVLMEWARHPKVTAIAKAICGPNIKTLDAMFINKPLDSGEGLSTHPMHQDQAYWPVEPAERIVGCWMAIDRAHRNNGCLTVIPGSHRWGMLGHQIPGIAVNAGFHGIVPPKPHSIESILAQRQYVELNTGDIVYFHPHLVHGSGLNKTDAFRQALTTHYTAAENHFVDLRTFPMGREANMSIAMDFVELSKDPQFKQLMKASTPEERDEIMALGQILGWKGRSRLVAGEQKGW